MGPPAAVGEARALLYRGDRGPREGGALRRPGLRRLRDRPAGVARLRAHRWVSLASERTRGVIKIRVWIICYLIPLRCHFSFVSINGSESKSKKAGMLCFLAECGGFDSRELKRDITNQCYTRKGL